MVFIKIVFTIFTKNNENYQLFSSAKLSLKPGNFERLSFQKLKSRHLGGLNEAIDLGVSKIIISRSFEVTICQKS